MDTPTISVLLPAYNCSQYIGEAIQSILDQTFRDFELIIIDDCSTDTTVEEILKFKDPRIVFVSKEMNTGYTRSLNYGIELAKGKYIARMDADDYSVAERFEMQVALLESNPNIILCGSTLKVYGSELIIDKPEKHDEIQIALLNGCPIAHPSIMARKDIMQRFLYDTTMEPAEDYDLWTRMIWAGEMYNIQKPLLHYRFHDTQVSTVRSKFQQQRSALIRMRYFCTLRKDNDDVDLLQRYFLKEPLSGKELKSVLLWLSGIRAHNSRSRLFPEPAFSQFISNSETSLIQTYFSTHRRGGKGLKVWFKLPARYFFAVLQDHLRYGLKKLILRSKKLTPKAS